MSKLKTTVFVSAQLVNLSDADGWLSGEKAAQLLGLKSPHTLHCWRNERRNPQPRFYKTGRIVRYRIEDIEEFLRLSACVS